MRSCAQSAYASLSAAEAATLLGFSNVKDFEAYARDREWPLDADGSVVFNEDAKPANAEDIPSASLINQTLLSPRSSNASSSHLRARSNCHG